MKRLIGSIMTLALTLTGTFSTVATATQVKMPVISGSAVQKEKQVVTYDSVTFGKYPQREVIPYEYYDDEATLNESVRNGNDYLIDKEVYHKLQSETSWDQNGDAVVDGEKYRRISYNDVKAKYGNIYTTFIWKGDKKLLGESGEFNAQKLHEQRYD